MSKPGHKIKKANHGKRPASSKTLARPNVAVFAPKLFGANSDLPLARQGVSSGIARSSH